MEFRALGPVAVAAGTQAIALDRGRRRTLLALLLAAGGESVTTEGLIASLWEGDPPASARKSLQSHLSRLRSELQRIDPAASSALVSEGDGYRLDLEHHTFDAARFESRVAQARELLGDAPRKAAAGLEEALAAWRGPAFGDLAAHPGVRAAAVRLEQVRLAAAADLVDARLALGEHEAVLADLEQAVAEAPLRERAHGQLMVALYRSGRQGDALATYRQLHQRLCDELGVEPSPAVRELNERILRQDPTVATPAPRRAVPGAAARPPATTVARDLVGRGDDVVRVADQVVPGVLVTLTGPGGVGKTSLAEQVAERVAERFDDGVVVAALAAVRDPSTVGEALVTALGIQPTGERAAGETLVHALGDRRLLLLLDNCEHVLDAVAPLVEEIRGRCPNVGVLATSRERLHVAGERLWPVAPLGVPDADAGPEAVAATAAGALFRARAEAVEPTFTLTPRNAPAIAELCRRLDGMPLAIELAAARLRAMSPQDLVARLDQRFSLLAGGPRHEAGRHRTLQAVVAWSYDLLDPVEARLFDRLSVFAGAFSLEDAEHVCAGDEIDEGEVAGLLGELVDKSMVVVERRRDQVRYRLLDTLREYGSRRLAEVDDPEVWRRRHADHHVRLVERLGVQVRGPREADAVVAIDAAFDDLRSAHAWLVGQDDVDGALRLPAALADHAFYRLRDEVTAWARRSVAMAGAVGHPAYAAALATAAAGATSRDECGRARTEAGEALDAADPDGLARAWALGALGTAALYEGRLGDLLAHAEEMAEVSRRLSAPYYLAFAGVLEVIGRAYRDEREEALVALGDLEGAAEESGSPTMRAFARYCRGEVHLDARPAAAAAALEEAVELARQVDNALIEGVSRVSLASLRGRLGDTELALRQFREIVVHWRRLGDHTHQLTTLRNLVVLLAQVGADETAALLHGAVTGGDTPTFGLEAQRLATAWDELEVRLGPRVATATAARGRQLGPTQLEDAALEHLDTLLDT